MRIATALMAVAALAGCATFSKVAGPKTTDAAREENRCALARVLPAHHFPGFTPDHNGVVDFDGKICAGFGYVPYNESWEKSADALDAKRLHAEIDRIVAAYQKVLAKIRTLTRRDYAIGILDSAMCYPYHDNGWGRRASPPRPSTVTAAFIEDPKGELGGPSYPRLLLMRAVALEDTAAAWKIIALFNQAAELDTFDDRRVTSNCGLGMNWAYRSQVYARLNVYEIEPAVTFAKRWRFLVTKNGLEQVHRHGRGDPNDIRTIAKAVVEEQITKGDYAYARMVAERFAVTMDEVRDIALDRISLAYKRAFRANDLSDTPEAAHALQAEFGFTDADLESMRIKGYADAGFEMIYAPCSPLSTCEHLGAISPRLPDLSHESRALIVQWLLGRYFGVNVDDLKRIHDFMHTAGIGTDEVRVSLAVALAQSASDAYAMQQQPGEFPNLVGHAQAIVYAVDRMGFDPARAYKADVCQQDKPKQYDKTVGVWFLRCSDGVNFARTLVAEK